MTEHPWSFNPKNRSSIRLARKPGCEVVIKKKSQFDHVVKSRTGDSDLVFKPTHVAFSLNI